MSDLTTIYSLIENRAADGLPDDSEKAAVLAISIDKDAPDDSGRWPELGYANHKLWRRDLLVTALDTAMLAYAKVIGLPPSYANGHAV